MGLSQQQQHDGPLRRQFLQTALLENASLLEVQKECFWLKQYYLKAKKRCSNEHDKGKIGVTSGVAD